MSQQGGNSSPRSGRNPAQNLSDEDRRKGGEHSAKVQQRDEFGQFAGRKDDSGGRGSSGGGRRGGEGGRSEGSSGGEGGKTGGEGGE